MIHSFPPRARYWLIGLTAVLLAGIAIYLLVRPRTQPLSASRLALDPVLGAASARVTIVEYGDFGCPTCRGWEQAGVRQELLQAYGDRIRFVWKDFPIITAESPKAAEAGQCAFEQGKFWEYHDLLYRKAPALSVQDLKTYAGELGLNTAAFDQCLDSGREAPKVAQSLNEARGLGFTATPAFTVNGQRLAGPAGFAVFKSLVDPLLAAGG